MSLTPRQRRHLKGLAHSLDPLVRIGMAGVTPGVLRAVGEALDAHELVKIKIDTDRDGFREGTQSVVDATGAALVHTIGRVAILYRPPSKRGTADGQPPRPPKITLPE